MKPMSASVNEAWLSLTDGDEEGKRMAAAHILTTLDRLVEVQREQGREAMFAAVHEIYENADPAACRQFIACAIEELAQTGWKWPSEEDEQRWLEEE
jgi:hypothetical protein